MQLINPKIFINFTIVQRALSKIRKGLLSTKLSADYLASTDANGAFLNLLLLSAEGEYFGQG